MDLRGEYRLPAARQAVWEALNDPATLHACIPGCESLEMTQENRMSAVVVAKVGPVKAKFVGEVRLEDIVAPESYSIVGEGKGGVAGFAKGGAKVHLAEDGEGTVLTYTVEAQVGGKIAQLGGRLVESTAKKLSAQFFDCFAARVSGEAAAGSAGSAEAGA